ncbi:MAG TPA: DUF1257 domain-containing protein [Candidatus Eremiobacteraeota bacterium]|nr:MAG: hypothetical protein BWY64_02060 [bacterium ADurb.Bin363]HPZ09133.1 DUF1257 domain-containing protein [Candidatus Eremiobacteraeota bacterium]
MSHFTTVKTKISDRECLKRAIKDLGYDYDENKTEIRGYQDRKIKVDILVKTGGTYEIGMVRSGDVYSIVADWWGVKEASKIDEKTFIPKLTQKYAYHKTREVLAEKGFVLSDEKVNENNEIILTVRQW